MTSPWQSRVLAIILLGALIVAVLGWMFRPQPVSVDVAKIVKGDLVLSVDEEGETRLMESYVISAPVAGRIERIEIEAGDLVVAGETVVARFIPLDPAIQDARALRSRGGRADGPG